MAFYAEMKRRCWFCVNGGNAIDWYRRKLYDDWYNSLTEEQKVQLEYDLEKKRIEEHLKLQRSFAFLSAVRAMLPDIYDRWI